jgi:16S rRNA processing protein RimM
MPERIRLGRILGGHGLQGEVRVRYFGDSPENIELVQLLFLGNDADSPELSRLNCRQGARASEVLMQLAGVSDREAADALSGTDVYADVEGLSPLPQGEYYWYQFVGCRVEDLEGRVLGVVQSLWDAGGHDLLVLEDAQGEQLLIPTSREVLREIDLEQQLLRVHVLPGLLETKAPAGEEGAEQGTGLGTLSIESGEGTDTGTKKKKGRLTGAARKRRKKRAEEGK